ncbi:MAG: hypothetical protein AB8B72_13845 [Crocinitomicaceae bacterium]
MEQEKDRLYKYFNEKPISEPSTDFTKLVMEKVEIIADKPFEIKPLISTKGWLYIVLIGIAIIISSFSIELADTVYKLPAYLNWESIKLKDFETSIKIGVIVVSILIVLTATDMLYRRMKNLA